MYRKWFQQTLCMAIIVSFAISQGFAGERDLKVRPAYCAGSWYPAEPAALSKQVEGLLAKASPPSVTAKPIAIISPHAGYRYSAPVAAAGYRCLQGHTYKRVIILAFSHRQSHTYQGVDVPRDLTAYKTPLGEVPIDREVCDKLLEKPIFVSYSGTDRNEHSLELQLPFLQKVLKDSRLVPLYVGRMSTSDYAAAAKAILPWLDEDTLLVASSDFTHFGPNYGYTPFKDDVPKQIRQLADNAAKPIMECDFDGFLNHLTKTQDTICGRGPIKLLLRILSMKSRVSGVRAAFDTSGNLTGDWTNSVTYQSIVFTPRQGSLGQRERQELLKLARRTVTAQLKGEKPPEVNADKLLSALRADGACFVTLENHGRLRGCIGNIEADRPLYQAVINNAVSACKDYRFVHNPVTAEELHELHIEISYLTPLRRVTNTEEIIVGRHGLWMILGRRKGTLLPQVAYERGWTREEFLAHTCQKAGLPLDAWRHPDAEIYSYEAEVFGEEE